MSLAAMLAFNAMGRAWRIEAQPWGTCDGSPARKQGARFSGGVCKRMLTIFVCAAMLTMPVPVSIYNHAKVISSDGEQIPLRESIRNILKSEAFKDFMQTLRKAREDANSQGWDEAWRKAQAMMDPTGEMQALKVRSEGVKE